MIAWIRINDGGLFEGTPEQYDDTFGGVFFTGPGMEPTRNPDEEVKEAVRQMHPEEKIEFFDEVPPEFRRN